jgi:hypothetical protein
MLLGMMLVGIAATVLLAVLLVILLLNIDIQEV